MCVWGIKCVCCSIVSFLQQKVKTWLGTEVPITVRGNNRVEWWYRLHHRTRTRILRAGIVVCQCVLGRRGCCLCCLGAYLWWEMVGRHAKRWKGGSAAQQTDRQLLSAPQCCSKWEKNLSMEWNWHVEKDCGTKCFFFDTPRSFVTVYTELSTMKGAGFIVVSFQHNHCGTSYDAGLCFSQILQQWPKTVLLPSTSEIVRLFYFI